MPCPIRSYNVMPHNLMPSHIRPHNVMPHHMMLIDTMSFRTMPLDAMTYIKMPHAMHGIILNFVAFADESQLEKKRKNLFNFFSFDDAEKDTKVI
jgi:hypothetical protein